MCAQDSVAYFKSGEIVWDELTAKGNLTATDEETAREAVLERFPGAAILSMKPLDYEMGWRFTVKLADESGVGASTREDEATALSETAIGGRGSPTPALCGSRLKYGAETVLVCDRPKGHAEPHYDSSKEGIWDIL